jgi:hypothetical protein
VLNDLGSDDLSLSCTIDALQEGMSASKGIAAPIAAYNTSHKLLILLVRNAYLCFASRVQGSKA